MPRLAGAAEIAVLLGVTRQRVHQLAEHADFPVPLADLANGRIWDLDQVEEWAVRTGRLKPRARKARKAAPPPSRAVAP